MIILNHPSIPSPSFKEVSSLPQIKQTSPQEIVKFKFDFELLNFCTKNGIKTAVEIASIEEAVFSNALGAFYLFCTLNLAKEVQKVADHYLFDAKVIAKISPSSFPEAIKLGIDGVYFLNTPQYS